MPSAKKAELVLREGDLRGSVTEHFYMSMSTLQSSRSYHFAQVERAYPNKYYHPKHNPRKEKFRVEWDGHGPDRLTRAAAEKDLPALFKKHVDYYKEHGKYLGDVLKEAEMERRRKRREARLVAKQ